MKEIKSFEDACKALGLDPAAFSVNAPGKYQAGLLALAKLFVIAEALNEGWVPDWSNGKWDKWFIWWNNSNGFSFCVVDRYCQVSSAPSRLCFRDRETAEYAAATFYDLFKEAYTI